MTGEGSIYRLTEVKLEVTHRCCLQCIHCSSEAGPDECREMLLPDAIRIVNEAGAMEVGKLAISGGEAVIWPGIFSLLDAVACTDMKPTLYSSGVGQQTFEVIEAMQRIPQARMIFSLYSHLPKIHDRITELDGSHRMTVAAIESSVSTGIRTELHFTAMRCNYQDLLGVCSLAKTLGVRKVSVLRLVPQGRSRSAAEDLLLCRVDNLKLQELLSDARTIIKTRVGSPYGFLHVSDSPQCSAGVDRLIILPGLTISPCDAFKQVKPQQVVGTDAYSRLDKYSLEDCWKRSPYLQTVRQHLQEPYLGPCRSCSALPLCFSGCTAQRYLARGELVRGPDPMCLMSRR